MAARESSLFVKSRQRSDLLGTGDRDNEVLEDLVKQENITL